MHFNNLIMKKIKTHSSYIPLKRRVKLIDWQGYITAKLKELRLGTNNLNVL